MYIDVFWSWWLYPTSRSWCPIFKIKCSAAHLLNADYIIMYIKNQTIKLHCTVWCKTYNVMDSFWKHWVCYLTNTKNNTHRMIWIYVHTFEILLDAMVKWPLFEYFWLLSGKKAQSQFGARGTGRRPETTADVTRCCSMHKHTNTRTQILVQTCCCLAQVLLGAFWPSAFQLPTSKIGVVVGRWCWSPIAEPRAEVGSSVEERKAFTLFEHRRGNRGKLDYIFSYLWAKKCAEDNDTKQKSIKLNSRRPWRPFDSWFLFTGSPSPCQSVLHVLTFQRPQIASRFYYVS